MGGRRSRPPRAAQLPIYRRREVHCRTCNTMFPDSASYEKHFIEMGGNKVCPDMFRFDMVDHPKHYGGKDNPHEHVKCMAGVLSTSPLDAFAGGLIYNCTKYLWRLGQKPFQRPQTEHALETIVAEKKQTLEDANKAKWYLDRLVQHLEEELKRV